MPSDNTIKTGTEAIYTVADAIREVATSMQDAMANGYASSHFTGHDAVELLLAIADKLDPQ